MVDRYPHSATLYWETEGSYDEASGKYSGGSQKSISLPECRFDYQGKNYVRNSNGDLEGYDYIVFAPIFDEEVDDTKATIYWNEKKRSLTVKHTEKYHYHVKIRASS